MTATKTSVLALPLVFVLACINSQHAEVRLANNPAGVDCYARCVRGTDSSHAIDCVAACPAAVRDDGSCEHGGACVERREFSRWKTTLVVLGAVAGVVALGAQ